MTENLEDERNDLNNNEIHINRGFELMLRIVRGRRRNHHQRLSIKVW